MADTYNLGKQFNFPLAESTAKPESTFSGKKYRITVLSEMLVRLEYNDKGIFEDRPTQLALFRDFNKPNFAVSQDKTYIEITTKYFKLSYKKEKPFKSSGLLATNNLTIELLNSEHTWYYGHHEVRNYYGTKSSLDLASSKAGLKKGLYSANGLCAVDDSKSMVFEDGGMLKKRDAKGIDVYVFLYRKNFAACLQDYFMLTGFPPLIPRYAFGNWWSKNAVYSQGDILDLAEDFDNNNIPISVMALDKNWHYRKTPAGELVDTGYSFDKELIPEPNVLIKKLHTKGIRVALSVNPEEGIHTHEDMYPKVISYLENQDGKKVPFAPFNARFLDIYLKLLIHPNDMHGVDFWWIDYKNKMEMETLYLLNHFHFYDSMRSNIKRGLILSRNTTVAGHRYPVHYSGQLNVSWKTLKTLPYYNSSSANIGISYWSHDIGGYSGGTEDNELYTRFVQFGVFSPIFRFSSKMGKYYKREPWKWAIKTQSIVTEYMRLRHKLIPYLYSEAREYSKTGSPIIKPIYYTEPDLYDDPLFSMEYYFGSAMVIAPITNKKNHIMNRTVHRFFLPKGTWYDFFTGKKFPGGQQYASFYKDDEYPVFVKSGSILPLSLDIENNNTNPPTNMEVQVFPGESNEYKLYEDDGYTQGYKDGRYLITSFDYNYQASNHTIIVRPVEGKQGVVPRTRNYRFRFRNTKVAKEVIAYINDKQIEIKSYKDGSDFIVEATKVSTTSQLTLNCKGEDIEIDAVRIINDDIDGIISDMQIETLLKEDISDILFSNLPMNKKRIQIRKLKKKGLDRKFIKVFLLLLKYIDVV